MVGYNSQQSVASPGPVKGRSNRGPPGPGPATPQQNHSIPYQDPRSPQLGRQSPIAQQQPQIPNVGNQLADLDPDQLRPDQKREGPDWYAVFNPRIRRVLDVELVHNLLHESVVCCVRFSLDGRYVATGCNRSAQIFEVSTGSQVAKLQDDSVDKDGDLYIRSVCFSPDGKYLATGAEDKQIRVRRLLQVLKQLTVSNILTDCERFGRSKHAPSGTLLPGTSRTSTRLTLPAMANTSHPAVVIEQFAFGISITARRCLTLALKMVSPPWPSHLLVNMLQRGLLTKVSEFGIVETDI